MQIDFHHAVTYVTAQIAGFNHEDANIVAYAAQYVDDATNDGFIAFENECMYYHIASAHKMLDYQNFDELANHHAWIPFHFLPGNEGLTAHEGKDLDFVQKIICRPNSHIARDMVRESIVRRNDPWGLHRLGITMHVYADTWAHQGFVGIQHTINRVNDLRDADNNPDAKLIGWLKDYFGDKFDEKASSFVSDVLPLGHGAALSHPDKPFLKWSYTDGVGQKITRDNPTDFLDAADNMCKAMQCYLAGDPEYKASGLPSEGKVAIDTMLRTIDGDNGADRHNAWIQAPFFIKVSEGAEVSYVPKGTGSWKYQAIGTTEEENTKDEHFPYNPEFLKADWKLFHDALQVHRLFILHDLLPRYGICAA